MYHSLSQDVVAMETKDLQLPPAEQGSVKRDHPGPVDKVVAVALQLKLVCPVQGAEEGERGTREVVQEVSPVPEEEAEEREVSVAATLALISLTEIAVGAGMTGDLGEEGEEELDQGHICLMAEHHLTRVNSDQ